jgi:chemotaxis protein MotB
MFSSDHPVQQRQRIITPQNTTPLQRWRAPAEDENSWWSITFSDLVLLLLCFVILWHLSEKRHLQLLTRSQETPPPQHQDRQEPSEETRQFSDAPDPETTVSHPHDYTKSSLELAAAPALPTQPVSQTLSPNPGWRELQSEITRYVHEQGLDRAVGVVSTEQGLVISLSDTITFPSGQAALNAVVTPLLSRVAALASERTELNIEIAGHTDDRPIATPEFPSNWELSAARASRVARTLLEQEKIDPTRISTRGFAHYRPLYTNDTEEHRAANRRVELRFFRRVKTVDERSYEW